MQNNTNEMRNNSSVTVEKCEKDISDKTASAVTARWRW